MSVCVQSLSPSVAAVGTSVHRYLSMAAAIVAARVLILLVLVIRYWLASCISSVDGVIDDSLPLLSDPLVLDLRHTPL